MSTPYLFQRQWKLTLLPRGTNVASVYVSEPETGSPLQVQFDIARTLHSTSNKATFRLFNLAPQQRQSFDVGTRVVFDCGYGANWTDYASRIYLGDVAKKTIKQEGPDIVLELECGDSELQLQQCFVKAEFAAPTSLAAIVDSICSQLQVEIAGQVYQADGKAIARFPDVKIERFSQMGPARTVLTALLKGRGVDWSFQNGQLYFQAASGVVSVVATNLTPETGLLERPFLSEQGMTCRALIQAGIAPGSVIALETAELDVGGNYRVVEAHYKGETMGGDWAVEVNAERLGAIGNPLAPYVTKASQESAQAATDNTVDEIDSEAAQ